MWLFHRPLCGFVRVTAVNPDSQACPTVIPEFVLTGRTLALAVVLGLAVIMILRQLARLEPPDASDRRYVARDLLPLAAIAGGATIALVLASSFVTDIAILDLTNIAVEPVAILAALPLGALALVVATARDARRFVVGTVTAVVAEFLIFYPNISALPLPSAVVNAYQGVLPTYVYPFQFPVSTVDRSVQGPSLFALEPAVLLAALVATSLIVAYSAWAWRIAIAERNAPSRPRATWGRPWWAAGAAEPGPPTQRPAAQAEGPTRAQAAGTPVRGEAGTGAWKPLGSWPCAARRRITKP